MKVDLFYHHYRHIAPSSEAITITKLYLSRNIMHICVYMSVYIHMHRFNLI